MHKVALVGYTVSAKTISNHCSNLEKRNCGDRIRCDVIPERAQDAAEKIGRLQTLYRLLQMLKETEADLVTLCTPSYSSSISGN